MHPIKLDMKNHDTKYNIQTKRYRVLPGKSFFHKNRKYNCVAKDQ